MLDPTAYLKCLALLVPREHKVEQSNPIKAMTDEQLDEALAALRELVAKRAAEAARVIEGTAEPVALPAPEAPSHEATPEPTQKHKSNRLMREADTAVGPREKRVDQGAHQAFRVKPEQAMKRGRGRDFAFALEDEK